MIGTPYWANASAGWNAAPTKTADLQAFVTAAARRYSGTYKGAGRRDRSAACAKWIAWNEPNNPVFLKPQFVRSGSKWVMQSPKDYARICNAVVKAVKSVHYTRTRSPAASRRRAGNNQPGTAAVVGVAARLPARDEARRRDGLRRLRAPPVLRLSRPRRRTRRRRPASAACRRRPSRSATSSC